jgi:hypothetical protein
MGGGRPILTFISTLAIVGIGTIITNTKNNVPKNNFFISILLSLDVQSYDCNVNKSNSYIVISMNPYSVPDNYFQGQRAGST